jgi:hypothetical protein
MLRGEFRPFVGGEPEPFEIAHLPFELLALGGERRGVGVERDAAVAALPPFAVKLRDLTGGFREAAEAVQQLALRGGAPTTGVMLAEYPPGSTSCRS